MLMRSSISSVTLIGVLCASLNGAWALDETWAPDETKYPNWKGQWVRADSAETAPWDARKPWGLGQQPPLTPEYQAIFEANLKQLAAGVRASDPTVRCIPAAMPRVMMAIHPMEIVIMPDTTYIMVETSSTLRRIFTDGRAWPKEREPSYAGFSIGQWEDTDRDGRFDTLDHDPIKLDRDHGLASCLSMIFFRKPVPTFRDHAPAVETRWIKGPHSYDDSGIPLHADEQAVIKERISSDKRDPGLLHNEI